ncbi:MAG: hypothetical protein J6A01_01485, partial [Proteobacteria bacterium]|nr:hypothetical protein [Pseudomonadota bacterium]
LFVLGGCSDKEDGPSAELIKLCHDNIDNDGDLETDCDDDDCLAACNDDDDPDWSVPGAFCKASELGMIPNASTPKDQGHNFFVLKTFIEEGGNEKCTNLEVDGVYPIMPVRKDGDEKATGYIHNFIALNRMVHIKGSPVPKNSKEKGGTFDFGDYKGGFKLRPDGGIVMENMKLSSNGMSSSYTFFDACEYANKYHGTADRIMFRDCEFNIHTLFRIRGVIRNYNDSTELNENAPTMPYQFGSIIKLSEIAEKSTRIKRISVKNCHGRFVGRLMDMAVLNKYEIVGNHISLPCTDSLCLAFEWSTSNEINDLNENGETGLSNAIQFQGNSHAIVKNNTITGPDGLYLRNTYYSGGVLYETKRVNYEGNHIENFLIRSTVVIDDKTGEPMRDKDGNLIDEEGNILSPESVPVYDAYLSSTQVVARNNTIKNVIGFPSYYTIENYHELMKSKSAPASGLPKIRWYENNTFEIDEKLIDKYAKILLDGGTFEDGTSVKPMYLNDNGTKRKLNEAEREAYIRDLKTWYMFHETNIYDAESINISNNTIHMPGLYLYGASLFSTRKFTANGNHITAKYINAFSGTQHIFGVFPYKYKSSQSWAYKTQNDTLNPTIEVTGNEIALSDQFLEVTRDNYIPKNLDALPSNSAVLLEIRKSTDPAYIGDDGEVHPVEFKYDQVTYQDNVGKDGLNLIWCEGSGAKSATCYQ